MSLAGKVALVTGAGKNIGRAIALDLAGHGASLVINGRSDRAAVDSVVAEIKAAGGQAIGCLADVSDAQATTVMIETAVATFGGIDILISNAGLRRQTPFLEMSLAEWREILSVALDGAFILCRAAVPHMLGRGGGAIVGLSGISTHVGTPNRCHVSASKAGLEGLMRALAVELAPHRITCNTVAPGGGGYGSGCLGRDITTAARECPAWAEGSRGGDCRGRAIPGRAGGALHHRPNLARKRRRIPDLTCAACNGTDRMVQGAGSSAGDPHHDRFPA